MYEEQNKGAYEEQNKVAAETLSTLVNSFSFDAEGVAKAMSNQHRTLQQAFTSLCIEWLKMCASDTYRTDGRNEASHNVAVEIKNAYNHNHTETTCEFFDDITLPMV